MKDLIWIIIGAILFLYISGISIQFNPFKIEFKSLADGFGYFFLTISITLFLYSAEKKGYKEGYKKAVKDLIEIGEVEIKLK